MSASILTQGLPHFELGSWHKVGKVSQALAEMSLGEPTSVAGLAVINPGAEGQFFVALPQERAVLNFLTATLDMAMALREPDRIWLRVD